MSMYTIRFRTPVVKQAALRLIALGLGCFVALGASANDCPDDSFAPQKTGKNKFEWKDSAYLGVQVVEFGEWLFDCWSADASISEEFVTLNALRFDPRYATLELGLTSERVTSLNASEGDIFLTEDRDAFRKGANLATIAFFDRIKRDDEIAFINATWWLEADETAVAGLLRIDGKTVSNTVVSSLSAVICLDDRDPATSEIDHQVITVWNGYPDGYHAYDKWFVDTHTVQPGYDTPEKQKERWQRIRRCPSYFQAGPRIVEYNTVREFLVDDEVYGKNENIACLKGEKDQKAGVCDPDFRKDREASSTIQKRRRVILALDNRGPDLPRRVYLISTEQAVSAYQMQKILLREDFYGDAKPHVAVNLASSDKSGLVIKDGKNGYFVSGSVDEVVPSYLTVKLKEPGNAQDADD